MVEMNETTVIKTFGETADIIAIIQADRAGVSSTKPIAKIGDYLMG